MTDQRKKLSAKAQISVLGRAAPPCEICLIPTSFSRYLEIGDKRVGRFAHIRAVSSEGSRFDPEYPRSKIDEPENLFWCCTDCHDIVDKTEKWSIEKLLMKLEENRSKIDWKMELTVDGEIQVSGQYCESVVGIDAAGRSTTLKPGTRVKVDGFGSKNVTGVKN